ncbi:MAG TPA: alpha/beta hydrolase [Ktedonobacteraceae bacterium]|nr:alpha/beta hydrolase [Ktedonobacteraceae bacterium]
MLPYRLEGDGPPLLLIHGWGVTYKVWRNLVPLLKPHFQLVLVELPGVGAARQEVPGKSYYPACAEALEELRGALGCEQWSILAYSTGTRAGEAYMQLYPQRVIRSVFLCPIYLRESWKLALDLEQWIDARRSGLANWIISDWRLYGMLLALGFNLHGKACASEWMREIELQPLDNLKRMLLELPGKGRAPFTLPAAPTVPTLFVWGRQDALTARPRHPRPNDVFISANHSAPVLAAQRVAEVVLPFLREGQLLPQQQKTTGVHFPACI